MTAPARHPPYSIRVSVRLVLALVGLSVVNALLNYFYLDEMAAAAVRSDTGATAETIRASIVVVSLLDMVGLGTVRLLLARALRRGANGARIVLTLLALLGMTFGVVGLRVGSDRQAAFVLTGLVAIGLNGALLYFLWRRDSSAFLTGEGVTDTRRRGEGRTREGGR